MPYSAMSSSIPSGQKSPFLDTSFLRELGPAESGSDGSSISGEESARIGIPYDQLEGAAQNQTTRVAFNMKY